jgi:cytochrome P450
MNVQTSIRTDKTELLRQAREEAYATPLADFHPGAPRLFQDDTLWPWFERLRKEEPVHYCTNSPIEPYWSVTRYNDIMHVDTNHGIFSSEAGLGGITIRDLPPGYDWPSFITMDQPKHAARRRCSRRHIWTSSQSSSAGGRPRCSTSCRATRPSISSSSCRLN